MAPKLSILMPNYNYGHFLEESIGSVGLHEDVEIVVVDDGSTDASHEILERLAQENPSLRLFLRKDNRGAIATINECVERARGTYLHFFASDDLLIPGSVEALCDLIDRHKNVALFCGDGATFTMPGQVMVKRALEIGGFRYFSPKEVRRLFLLTDFALPGQAILVQRALYRRFGPLDERLSWIADWFLNHRMALEVGVGYLPCPFIAQRLHPGALSFERTREQKREVWLALLSKIESQGDASFTFSVLMRRLGVRAIYRDLVKNPRYWKFLFPILFKMLIDSIIPFIKNNM